MPKLEATSAADLLRQSGSLHVQAYLLRLLEAHRPDDPLTFLHAVLHRSQGGMTLPLPLLAEFVAATLVFPRAALLRTIVYSTRDLHIKLTNKAHLAVVLDAAALVSRSVEPDQLPTDEELIAVLDASAAALLIFAVARSRVRLLKRLGDGGANGTHRLRLVVELDATTDGTARRTIDLLHPPPPPSGKSASTANGGSAGEAPTASLAERAAAKVMWLTAQQPHKAKVVFVVVGPQAKLRDPTSPISRLVAAAMEAMRGIEPPALRDAFSVCTGDAATAAFPVLAGAAAIPISSSAGGATGGLSSSSSAEVVTLWVRDPTMLGVGILQAGHFVEPFLSANNGGCGIAFPEVAAMQQMLSHQRRSAASATGNSSSEGMPPAPAPSSTKGAAIPQTLSPPCIPGAASRASLLLTHLAHAMLNMALPQDALSIPSLSAANIVVLKASVADALGAVVLPPHASAAAASPVCVALRLLVRCRLDLHKTAKLPLADLPGAAPSGGGGGGGAAAASADSSSSGTAAVPPAVPCCYALVGQGVVAPPAFFAVDAPGDEAAALIEAAATVAGEFAGTPEAEHLVYPWPHVWSILTAESWTGLVHSSDPLALLSAHPARRANTITTAAAGDPAAAAAVVSAFSVFEKEMPAEGRLSLTQRTVVQYQGEEPATALRGNAVPVALTAAYVAERPFWVANLPPPTPQKAAPVVEKKKPAAGEGQK